MGGFGGFEEHFKQKYLNGMELGIELMRVYNFRKYLKIHICNIYIHVKYSGTNVAGYQTFKRGRT